MGNGELRNRRKVSFYIYFNTFLNDQISRAGSKSDKNPDKKTKINLILPDIIN